MIGRLIVWVSGLRGVARRRPARVVTRSDPAWGRDTGENQTPLKSLPIAFGEGWCVYVPPFGFAGPVFGTPIFRACARRAPRWTLSGNMTDKPAAKAAHSEGDLERELRATLSSGIGALLEIGDHVNVVTNSGTQFEGVVEDVNLVAFLVRKAPMKEEPTRLFLVSMNGFEYLEIIEDDEEDDGDGEEEDAGGEEATTSPATASADVTPITKASTRAA